MRVMLPMTITAAAVLGAVMTATSIDGQARRHRTPRVRPGPAMRSKRAAVPRADGTIRARPVDIDDPGRTGCSSKAPIAASATRTST